MNYSRKTTKGKYFDMPPGFCFISGFGFGGKKAMDKEAKKAANKAYRGKKKK